MARFFSYKSNIFFVTNISIVYSKRMEILIVQNGKL